MRSRKKLKEQFLSNNLNYINEKVWNESLLYNTNFIGDSNIQYLDLNNLLTNDLQISNQDNKWNWNIQSNI